jgi:hypothetical protein
MSDTINFSFQVLQTTIRVIYDDLTQLDADAIVSPDDVYLSASSGMPKLIHEAAGRTGLRRDIRKFALPLPVGSVAVTSAGRLQAKYLLHAAALDINTRSDPKILVPYTAQRVLNLANALQVERLISPLLVMHATGTPEAGMVTQLTRVPEAEMLDLLLRSAACYIVTERRYTSLHELTIALYRDDVDDHGAAEQHMLADIESVCQTITEWVAEVEPINDRIGHMQPLIALMIDDPAFQAELEARVQAEKIALHNLFGGHEGHIAAGARYGVEQSDNMPLDQQEYERLKNRLLSVLSELVEEITPAEAVRKAKKERLNILQVQAASQGISTPPQVTIEIEHITNELSQIDAQVEHAKKQQMTAQQELATLEHRWEAQQRAQKPA